MIIYIIGSLRNPEIPNIANKIQEAGHEAFADWYAAGPEADDKWRDYEKERGRDYLTALGGYAARNVFEFDKKHLERADAVILVAPAGKSGHLELGWSLGKGKLGYYLLDTPERWDVMLQFCTMVTDKLENIVKDLDAKSAQQAPLQEEPAPFAWDYLRRATNQMGKSLRSRPSQEGEGSRGSIAEVSGIHPSQSYFDGLG
jgi:hypothetical protein